MKTFSSIFPLLFLCALLEITSSLATSGHSIGVFNSERMFLILMFYLLLFLSVFVVLLILSLTKQNEYINLSTGHINIVELWKSILVNYNIFLNIRIIAVFFIIFGITSTANLVNIYQQQQSVWYDNFFFSAEESLINSILITTKYVNIVFFDEVYKTLWPILFLGLALIYVFKSTEYFLHISTTVIVAFVCTRLIGLSLPTAGPIFYKPDIFNVSGTASELWQYGLKLFMEKKIEQQILFPGTMAMPSLHVGLTYLALIMLFHLHKKTLFFTLPFLILTWLSTILLGWHYMVDGLGGILVMQFSMFFSKKYNEFLNRLLEKYTTYKKP